MQRLNRLAGRLPPVANRVRGRVMRGLNYHPLTSSSKPREIFIRQEMPGFARRDNALASRPNTVPVHP